MPIKNKDINIQIPAPDIKLAKVKIRGLTPLIYHKWSEKAKKQMLDKQMKKATTGKREVRNPEKEYVDTFYYDENSFVSFPANSLKQAIVGAARFIDGVPMTLLRGAVFIMGSGSDNLIPVKDNEKLVKKGDIEKNSKEYMREDMVRVGMGTADIRFRGQLKNWSMEFLVKYNAGVLSLEQVMNLLQTAGFSCGLGEWRPERNGDFGTFEIVTKG